MYEEEFKKIPERVANGIKWLNEQDPEWYKKIDLSSLAMENGCLCILGQLYGHFDEGFNKLKTRGGFSYGSTVVYMAFDAPRFKPTNTLTVDSYYQALQAEWVNRISMLRAQEGEHATVRN